MDSLTDMKQRNAPSITNETKDIEESPAVLVARYSVDSITQITSPDANVKTFGGWELFPLRKTFKTRKLEELFGRYQQRVMNFNLVTYLRTQICASVVFVLFLLLLSNDTSEIVPDLTGQAVLVVVSTVAFLIVRREEWIKSYPSIHVIVTLAFTFLLLSIDLGTNLWSVYAVDSNETSRNETRLHVPHGLYVILVVYNFLPLSSLWQIGLIGIAVGVFHTVYSSLLLYIMNKTRFVTKTVIVDGIYFLAANCVGMYSKILQEITLRNALYDRRQCLESTFRLEYEKDQETKLLLSILPQHMAVRLKSDIRNAHIYQQNNHLQDQFSTIYIETYQDVSILFSDIVNFTSLTVTLTVRELVQTLNDLYGKFDEVAEINKCLRIKILGDCYYCVSGIPEFTAEHAKNCVEMGLRMIDIIQSVGEDRGVDVNMRIGVHSGKVTSGVVGILKWQFDIWSRDVTVANRLEQSGKPGKVHISMATKEKLGNAYEFEPGDGHLRDYFLAKEHVTTYFVITERDKNHLQLAKEKNPITGAEKEEPLMNHQLDQTNDCSSKPIHPKDAEQTKIEETFIDPTFSQAEEKDANDLSDWYIRFPEPLQIVSTATDNGSPGDAPSTFPHMYTKTQRHSTAFVGEDRHANGVATKIQRKFSATAIRSNSYHNPRKSSKRISLDQRSHRRTVLMDSSLSYYVKMQERANSYMSNAIELMALSKVRQQQKEENQVSVDAFLFFSKRGWEWTFLKQPDILYKLYPAGVALAFIAIAAIQLILIPSKAPWIWACFGVTLILILISLLVLWIGTIWSRIAKTECDEEAEFRHVAACSAVKIARSLSDKMETHLLLRIAVFFFITAAVTICALIDVTECSSDGDIQEDHSSTSICFYPWYFTYSCAMALLAGFIFYRVYFLLKLFFYVTVIVIFSLLVIHYKADVFQDSGRSYFRIPSPAAVPNAPHIIYLVFIALLLHVSDRQIEFIHRSDFIWKRRFSDEEREAYIIGLVNKTLLVNILPKHVALKYLDPNRTEFGLYHEQYKTVAVMFASIPNYNAVYDENTTNENDLNALKLLNDIIIRFDKLIMQDRFATIEKIKIIGSTYMAACGLTPGQVEGFNSVSNGYSQAGLLVATLVKFAWEMEQVLEEINQTSNYHFQLRIGMDCGPVIAGVVGAQKPLYDIWGDTVNVASRMDYTGEQGKIQVRKKVAAILEGIGYHCVCRGETYVKGKGYLETYWVVEPNKLATNVAKPRTSLETASDAIDTSRTRFNARRSQSRLKPTKKLPQIKETEDSDSHGSSSDDEHTSSESNSSTQPERTSSSPTVAPVHRRRKVGITSGYYVQHPVKDSC